MLLFFSQSVPQRPPVVRSPFLPLVCSLILSVYSLFLFPPCSLSPSLILLIPSSVTAGNGFPWHDVLVHVSSTWLRVDFLVPALWHSGKKQMALQKPTLDILIMSEK